jgi:hypothetical protein
MRGKGWFDQAVRAREVGCALAAVVATLSASPRASAHSVTVDGNTSEWIPRAPSGANLGIVARDASSRGALVWLDARTDTRTDLFTPESGADLTTFAVTADATNLYFRVGLVGDATPIIAPVQIQIAIDVDRVAGSGNTPFAGFADTDVAAEAAWERLVQTQGGLGGTVQVRDTTYASIGVGAMATNASTNETEIAIPWALLPPGTHDALRFTVAVFRESGVGDALDVMGSSDALDVISDYGDPSAAIANTWIEVMDGVVNHSLEVWFDRTGREPYAPLLVSRFLSDAPSPATEWVEIRNQSPVTLDLSRYALGDEETVDAGEYMGSFPAGATLTAGEVAVVAASAADYLTAYGVPASYQSRTGAGPAVDLSRVLVWSDGASLNLANGGDELLVLGWNRTIVDVVAFATGSYPGVTARPAPGANRLAVREPERSDTDDCALDFPLTLDDCGPGAGSCGSCRACQRNACVIDAGAACDDGDACTSGTTCSVAAVCTGGAGVSCDDGNACTADSCDPTAGCRNTVSPGALCDDGNACTASDVCLDSGSCGGTPIGCDDMNPCTDDTCRAGGCVHTPATGRACSDGSLCTSSDACTATGACAGSPVTCPEDANPCTTARCAPATGCGFANNTAACDDGNACTSADVCAAGACAGTPISCDDRNACTTDTCSAGTCRFAPATGSACDDGNACTASDACDGAGLCVGRSACDAASTDAALGAPDAFEPSDAFTPSDAGMGAEEDAGASSGEDAGASSDEDAGMTAGEDAAVTTPDAGATTVVDASIPGADAGSTDGGRRDGGGLDAAGSGLPPASPGCACRVEGRADRGLAPILALLGLAFAIGRRRARGASAR